MVNDSSVDLPVAEPVTIPPANIPIVNAVVVSIPDNDGEAEEDNYPCSCFTLLEPIRNCFREWGRQCRMLEEEDRQARERLRVSYEASRIRMARERYILHMRNQAVLSCDNSLYAPFLDS
jgi:hypothetical protein